MKRTLLSLCVACLAIVPALAQTTLSKGTILQLRVTSEINSAQATTPTAIVEADLVVNGTTVIKKGTPVLLQVKRKKARGCGRPGEVKVDFLSTTATDGQTIQLSEGSIEETGLPRKGLALGSGIGACAGIAATVTAVIGILGSGIPCGLPALALLMIKGEQAVIPANTIVPNVLISNDYIIK